MLPNYGNILLKFLFSVPLRLFVALCLFVVFGTPACQERPAEGAVDTAIAGSTASSAAMQQVAIDSGRGSGELVEGVLGVRLKYTPRYGYDQFPSGLNFSGESAPIQYASHPLGERFRTVLTRSYDDNGLNFGGHYSFVTWGCGTGCQQSALVDLGTGQVYEGPTATRGYAYQPNSRLLLVNPPDAAGTYEDCADCAPKVYVWDEEQKAFVEP